MTGLLTYSRFDGTAAKIATLALSLAGCAFVERLLIRQTLNHPWAQTLLDMPGSAGARSTTAGASEYDLFISYKSEDAPFVRLVVERLLASRLKVWFAEYAIRLERREMFQQMIDAAIPASRCGVIFTRASYFDSQHCTAELKLLHAHSVKIIEVQLERYDRDRTPLPVPAPDDRLELDHDSSSVGNLLGKALSFISHGGPSLSTGISTPSDDKPEQQHSFHAGPWAYTLDLTDWRLLDKSPSFEKEVGGYHLVGNVIAGSERITPRLIPNLNQARPLDERQCFDSMIGFARSYLSGGSAKLLGVHLLFHNGFSHLGLTYWRRGAWIRRYSIVLLDKRSGRDVEFAFTFSFFGPFREFCLQAGEMDRVASSLRFD